VVDPDTLRRRLAALALYRARLAALASLPGERFVTEQAYAGRYLVQAAAQACIDLANHVISSEGWRVPIDYHDAFTVLEEHDVLPADSRRACASSPGCATGSCTCTPTSTTASSTPTCPPAWPTSTPTPARSPPSRDP
jgi:hypothetical protein